jgi:chromosomal replication initiator protein
MITPIRLQHLVAEYYDVSRDGLIGNRRKEKLVMARHMAMYLARVTLGLSYPDVGREFRRDHTTVIHAVRKMARYIREDESVRADMEEIRKSMSDDLTVPAPAPRALLSDEDREQIVSEVIQEISRRFLKEAA